MSRIVKCALTQVHASDPADKSLPELKEEMTCDPRGNILAEGSRDQTELVVADLDLTRDVREQWQFYRDRRPEAYDALVLDETL